MPRKKIVLIAGLEEGRGVAKFLLSNSDVEVAGVFVIDEKYSSGIAGFKKFDDIVDKNILHKIRNIKDHIEDLNQIRPDLIFVVGISQIIPKAVLDIPPLGTIGFHSAILPGRRGCSPIIWAIIEGLKETGVTMFYMNDVIDGGDIIGTQSFSIDTEDNASDVLKKADNATINLTKKYLPLLLSGKAPRKEHNLLESLYTPKRTPADGEIDWSKSAEEIYNKIRALAPPYPMAHSFGGDGVPIFFENVHLGKPGDVPQSKLKKESYKKERVLCVVAHPDDEVLGVGGALSVHSMRGDDIVIMIMSDGEDGKLNETPKNQERRLCAHKVAEMLSCKELIMLDIPDQKFDFVPFIDIIKPIENIIQKYQPTIIYTHHIEDANSDHNIVTRATCAASRPMSDFSKSIKKILLFETPSSTDQAPPLLLNGFRPNVFIDIEPVWDQKLKLLNIYSNELIGGNHPRSIEYIYSLARMRGAYAGIRVAEGFMLVRERML